MSSPLTPRVSDIAHIVDELAPHHLAEAWDNIGLQVGDPNSAVQRVMTCLELTEGTLHEAVQRQVQVVVSHHPLIFKPLTAIQLSQPIGRLIAGLLREGVALIAAHTNLDSAAWGTNHVLAQRLGFTPEAPLCPQALEPDSPQGPMAGLGLLATLPSPRKAQEIAHSIKESLQLASVRLAGKPGRTVRRVAICTGSGGSLLGRAAARGVDLLITGEIHYHHAVEAHARGITVIELGHFETEQMVAEPLAQRLSQHATLQAAGVEVFCARHDLQPFTYV